MTNEKHIYMLIEPDPSTEELLIELCNAVNTTLAAKNVSVETFDYLMLHYTEPEREDIDFELCRRVLKKIEEDRRNA